jgi:hypothetical protein
VLKILVKKPEQKRPLRRHLDLENINMARNMIREYGFNSSGSA